jgi:hypothetical protein
MFDPCIAHQKMTSLKALLPVLFFPNLWSPRQESNLYLKLLATMAFATDSLLGASFVVWTMPLPSAFSCP